MVVFRKGRIPNVASDECVPGPTITRRTATLGLVCEGPSGIYCLVHDPSGERLHPTSMRTRRAVLDAAEALGTLDVDWTRSKAQIIAAADANVAGGFHAILEYLRVTASRSWTPGNPETPRPALDLPRLIAAECHFCGGNGIGSGGYGADGDQCGRCFDARPILRRRGWCMTSSAAIPSLTRSQWRELTPAERRKWNAYGEARRAADSDSGGGVTLVAGGGQ